MLKKMHSEGLPGPCELVQHLMSVGWSQQRIAEAVGATQPTICRIAKGEHLRPRHDIVDCLRRIVETLNDFREE